MIYAFPLWGLLYRAHQDPDLFYGWPIYFPQVNAWVVELMGTITIALFIIWCGQRVAYVLRRGRASTPQLTHVALILSHVLITAVSYLWVEEITRGWLFINIWHNLQYLVFVWAYNAQRAERSPIRGALADDLGGDAQVDPLKLIRSLSQPTFRSGASYLGLCLIAGTLFFIGADALVALGEPWMPTQGASLLLIVHLSINFHHYLVDAVIWTRKYNAPQQPH